MTFEEFIANDDMWFRSSYVTVKYNGIVLNLYVRKSIKVKGAFELANMNTRNEKKMGKGTFTAFLDQWEDKLPLMVELAHNPRLAAYLERRGWPRVDNPGYFYHHNKLYGNAK